ncbi:MAG: DMT family transporter [Eubacteriaceae bacterium]|nr:DMT family transporter [Eubacteriaceae bacterium]
MANSNIKRKGSLFIVAASVCWSFGGMLIQLIPWSAMCIVGLRAFLAAVVFAAYRKSLKVQLSKGNVLAAACLAMTTILFVFANKLTTAAAAILLQFSAPLFIILIELAAFKKKPQAYEAAAVGAAMLGMFLFFADRLGSGGMLGNILAIASGLAFAGVFVCNKRPDVDTEQSLMLGFMFNAVLGMPFVVAGVSSNLVAWLAILFLGIVQVGLAYVFFSIGIKQVPALLACLITALEPVLNPVWVAILTGEIPGLPTIAGGIIIISSVVWHSFITEKKAKRDAIEELQE